VISNSAYFEQDSLFVEEHPEQQSDRIIGFVSITLDKAVLRQKVYQLLINCVSIGIICWFISFPLIYFVSRKITKPIQELTENIKKFGERGKFEYFANRTNDEIGELAHAFNEMHLSLKKRETEKYQLEKRLQQSQKLEAIGSLSRSVAHEFNNILGIMVGYAELALTEIPCGVSLKNKIHEILKAGQKAKMLMSYLMIFSKKNEKTMKPFQVSVLVRETLEMLRVCLPASIDMREDILDDVVRVRCNPSQIHQMVTNLCTNAIEAMPNGGILDVSLKKIHLDFKHASEFEDILPGEYLCLTVKDTGCGIAPDIEEKIFAPFFTTKKMKDGAGMGLAMVHGIIKSYYGVIKVNSQKGKETVFTLFLPTVKSEDNSIVHN
jgi:signal transduction histidine kinase